MIDEDMPDPHPQADLFVCPTWDRHGVCICGASLPPQSRWIDAGGAWQRIECGECGRGYVDEEDFTAIYDDGLDDDPATAPGRKANQ